MRLQEHTQGTCKGLTCHYSAPTSYTYTPPGPSQTFDRGPGNRFSAVSPCAAILFYSGGAARSLDTAC